jgi:hypothetical protein
MAYDRLPAKFMHPKDLAARKHEIMERKRVTWRQDALMPVNRICQLIGDVPGSGAETGYVISRQTSAIVWDRHSQKWVAATCATQPAPVNKVARLVKASVIQP